MTNALPAVPPPQAPDARQWTSIAFVYWFAFMGVLTPGNIQNDLHAGVAPDLWREAARLLAAATLGASATPVLLRLARSAPLRRPHIWRTLAVSALAVAALAFALIVISCIFAAWAFSGALAPSVESMGRQLSADFLLLVFCLSLLLAAMHAAPLVLERRAGERWLERIVIPDGRRLVVVGVDDIEYIESQGNYQALHTPNGVRLHRATSTEVEVRLDPARFVRIHRRYLVALDKIKAVEPLSSGDALVRLASGAEIRQSRAYRRRLRERLAGIV
jgi:DNA-binding LytR/AlgR family response regulator